MSEMFANNSPTHPGAAESNNTLLEDNAPRSGDAPTLAAPPQPQLAEPQLAQPPAPPQAEPQLAQPPAPQLVEPQLAQPPAPQLVEPPATAPATGAPTLTAPATTEPSEVPNLPVVSPVLAAGAAPTLPDHVSPVVHDDTETDKSPADPDAEPEHPMAHLMPSKAVPSEASRRAAEQRAARRAKSKKIKIGVAAGALVFSAVVGPPLGKWLVDAINEAGDTSTEEPAE